MEVEIRDSLGEIRTLEIDTTGKETVFTAGEKAGIFTRADLGRCLGIGTCGECALRCNSDLIVRSVICAGVPLPKTTYTLGRPFGE